MSTLSKTLICMSSLAFVLAACEKKGETTNPEDASADAAPPADTDTDAETAEAEPHHGGEDHEHDFPGSVKDFHEVLSPLWHAEPGDARTESTCAATGDLLTKAQAVTSGEVPETASSDVAWQTHGGELVASVEALKASCEGDRAGFDAAFTAVHDAFHGLIEVIGQGH